MSMCLVNGHSVFSDLKVVSGASIAVLFSFASSTKQSNCEIINVHSGHICLSVCMPLTVHKFFMKSHKRVEFSSVQHCRNVILQFFRKPIMFSCSDARVSKYCMVFSSVHNLVNICNHSH